MIVQRVLYFIFHDLLQAMWQAHEQAVLPRASKAQAGTGSRFEIGFSHPVVPAGLIFGSESSLYHTRLI